MRLLAGTLDGRPIDHLEAFEAIKAATGATIQAFDARYVVSERHLERAVVFAERAIDREEAIADDRSVEILLYAAGRRQIERALEMGLKADTHPIVVLIDGGDVEQAATEVRSLLAVEHAPEAVLGDETRLRQFFDITDAELDATGDLEALIFERTALLTIDK